VTRNPILTVLVFFPVTGNPDPSGVRRFSPKASGINITGSIRSPFFGYPNMTGTWCYRPLHNRNYGTDFYINGLCTGSQVNAKHEKGKDEEPGNQFFHMYVFSLTIGFSNGLIREIT
jgi:hypothetical protein